jgi:hypothetical protein
MENSMSEAAWRRLKKQKPSEFFDCETGRVKDIAG